MQKSSQQAHHENNYHYYETNIQHPEINIQHPESNIQHNESIIQHYESNAVKVKCTSKVKIGLSRAQFGGVNSDQGTKCTEHDKDLELYCSYCENVICSECKIFGKHQKHQVHKLKDAVTELKEKLLQSLNKINLEIDQVKLEETKLNKAIKLEEKRTRLKLKDLNSQCNEIIQAVNRIKEDATKQLEYENCLKTNLLRTERKIVECKKTSLKNFHLKHEKILHQSDSSIATVTELSESLKSVMFHKRDRKLQLKPSLCGFKNFEGKVIWQKINNAKKALEDNIDTKSDTFHTLGFSNVNLNQVFSTLQFAAVKPFEDDHPYISSVLRCGVEILTITEKFCTNGEYVKSVAMNDVIHRYELLLQSLTYLTELTVVQVHVIVWCWCAAGLAYYYLNLNSECRDSNEIGLDLLSKYFGVKAKELPVYYCLCYNLCDSMEKLKNFNDAKIYYKKAYESISMLNRRKNEKDKDTTMPFILNLDHIAILKQGTKLYKQDDLEHCFEKCIEALIYEVKNKYTLK